MMRVTVDDSDLFYVCMAAGEWLIDADHGGMFGLNKENVREAIIRMREAAQQRRKELDAGTSLWTCKHEERVRSVAKWRCLRCGCVLTSGGG